MQERAMMIYAFNLVHPILKNPDLQKFWKNYCLSFMIPKTRDHRPSIWEWKNRLSVVLDSKKKIKDFPARRFFCVMFLLHIKAILFKKSKIAFPLQMLWRFFLKLNLIVWRVTAQTEWLRQRYRQAWIGFFLLSVDSFIFVKVEVVEPKNFG